MSAKLTPWFPADVKPVRNGIYQCREGYQKKWYWNGEEWQSPDFGWSCSLQVRQWRGLASDPSEVAK